MQALSSALEDRSSALFRHEVAYVLGQLAHAAAVPALVRTLRRTEESAMVRHECAEALGAIGSDSVRGRAWRSCCQMRVLLFGSLAL